MNIDYQKIDMLIRYVIAIAGQEDGWDREIGPIHIIKYVYLADLAYAEHNEGETYTGLRWQFYHYGPWSSELYNRIESALNIPRINKKQIPSQYDKDTIRWWTEDSSLYAELESKFGLIVSTALQKNIHRFTNNTPDLLHYVYVTRPMVTAAPNELLDFKSVVKQRFPEDGDVYQKPKPTDRQLKKKKEKLKALKERIQKRLNEDIKKTTICAMPPRYDQVFFNGLKQLDSQDSYTIESGEFTVLISDNVWKSKSRFDPDVS